VGIVLGIHVGLVGGLAGVLTIVPPGVLLVGLLSGLALLLGRAPLGIGSALRWAFDGLAGGIGGITLGVMTTGLAALLAPRSYAWPWRRLWSWWCGRPVPAEIEQALAQGIRGRPAAQGIWEPLLTTVAARLRQPPPIEDLLHDLTGAHWREHFVAYHVLVGLGGEVVEPLRQLAQWPGSPLHELAFDLLVDIAGDSAGRLGNLAPALLCKRCLVRCAPVRISLPGPDLHYYGCRSCGQNRDWVTWPGEVVAVLDRRMTADDVERDRAMWVNWSKRRAPFDFDRVEIGQASDEEVEALAVAVGNDTDPLRQERYGKMRCHVVAGCSLSENTRRILERTFGQVVIG
jgi:hypothetical protein